MANGISLGVLQMQKTASKDATPQYKVEPYGFLASLYAAHSPGVIENNKEAGHRKTVTIKAKKRVTPAEVAEEASCEVTNTHPYYEHTVSIANIRQYALHLSDDLVSQFDAYASQKVAIPGSTPTISGAMWEFMDSLQVACSAILSAVNRDLLDLALANLGVNRRTGVNTAATINIALNTTNNPLADGVTQILRDFRLNNMSGKIIAVGAGLFHNWILQQPAKGIDQSGYDSRIQAGGFDFYQDEDVTLQAGGGTTNHILVYEKDAVQIVEYMKYEGAFAGDKPGASSFGTIMLPMQTPDGRFVKVKFDYQLRYNDCEQEFGYVDGVEGVMLQKGYNLIISKNFGLYTIPSTAYKAADVLTGNRGSLRYNITNA